MKVWKVLVLIQTYMYMYVSYMYAKKYVASESDCVFQLINTNCLLFSNYSCKPVDVSKAKNNIQGFYQ